MLYAVFVHTYPRVLAKTVPFSECGYQLYQVTLVCRVSVISFNVCEKQQFGVRNYTKNVNLHILLPRDTTDSILGFELWNMGM